MPYEKPPDAYLNQMMKKANNKMNSNILPSQSLNEVIKQFEVEGMPHSLLYSTDLENPTVSAVDLHDKILAPNLVTPSMVYMADVTFGLTDISCGFSKWFFFTRVTSSKSISIITIDSTSVNYHQLFLVKLHIQSNSYCYVA